MEDYAHVNCKGRKTLKPDEWIDNIKKFCILFIDSRLNKYYKDKNTKYCIDYNKFSLYMTAYINRCIIEKEKYTSDKLEYHETEFLDSMLKVFGHLVEEEDKVLNDPLYNIYIYYLKKYEREYLNTEYIKIDYDSVKRNFLFDLVI